jgi:hypothetical protein
MSVPDNLLSGLVKEKRLGKAPFSEATKAARRSLMFLRDKNAHKYALFFNYVYHFTWHSP